MRLFIEPTEPLLFRTGRPFDPGESAFAESLFPPTPETLQGAIRAAIAANWEPTKNSDSAAPFNDPNLTYFIGNRDGYGCFRITSISLGRYNSKTPEEVERLFLPPAHIIRDDKKIVRLSPQPIGESIYTDIPNGIEYMLYPEQPVEGKLKPLGGWITEETLQNVLSTQQELSNIEVIKAHDIYEREARLGIGVQKGTKATEEGFLYQIQMIRMKPEFGFVIDFHFVAASPEKTSLDDAQIKEKLNFPEDGWLTLGGEQRAAYFRVLPTLSKSNRVQPKERTLLYLATPASFTDGWKPSSHFAPLDNPQAAIVNRYESIGGWKLNPGDAKGNSKTMRRCVPAGSVYFFNSVVQIPESVTDYGMEIGYGITYTGEW
jgi:CRISPR-associated protein Cmr3